MASPRSISTCETEEKEWSHLPRDLLSKIANSLGLIDLLSFRGVCKDWLSASSTASAHIELQKQPWFLLHGVASSDQCTLLTNLPQKFTLTIPEMDGSTCLFSYAGWLLLLSPQNSIFFLCPFSRFKIDLPSSPFSGLSDSDRIAAFSSPPTSPDCIVAVARNVSGFEFQLFLLRKGSARWTQYNYPTVRPRFNRLKGAAFQGGVLHVNDDSDGLITYDVEKKEWKRYVLVSTPPIPSNYETTSYALKAGRFVKQNIKEMLGLENNVSISTCPALVARIEGEGGYGLEFDVLIGSESIEAEGGSEIRRLEGIWIQPRYFHVSPDYGWLA